MIASSRSKGAPLVKSTERPSVGRLAASAIRYLIAAALWAGQQDIQAAEPAKPDPATEARIQAMAPDLEAVIARGMKDFDSPGLAIGIVAGDRLVYAKGFGARSKGGAPVDTRTVFQIGSTTKAFLATTIAMMVDRGKLKWDDRVVDLDPDFQMKDPWVTREFRVFDMIAQRSGLPPHANDTLGFVGIPESDLVRSLRFVDPVSSFRSTFAYTNITHLLAERVVAKAAGAPDWNTFLAREIFDPLGMKESSTTAEAIMAATNHAEGHRWTPGGTIEVPFTQFFPYDFGGAGDINSTVDDMARWVRLLLGDGAFAGRRIVSPEGLAATRVPKIALNDKLAYAQGWIVQQTPNGSIVWHNGGTTGFGAFVGLSLDRGVGVVVLTNEENKGLPDALGQWFFDRLLGNPAGDHVAKALEHAKTSYEESRKLFARPTAPRPVPPLPALAGTFTDRSFGTAVVRADGDALVIDLPATGAKLKLEPWDGDVFAIRLLPIGRFAGVTANLGEDPLGFAQFQLAATGKLDLLRLTFEGQAYDFRREGM